MISVKQSSRDFFSQGLWQFPQISDMGCSWSFLWSRSEIERPLIGDEDADSLSEEENDAVDRPEERENTEADSLSAQESDDDGLPGFWQFTKISKMGCLWRCLRRRSEIERPLIDDEDADSLSEQENDGVDPPEDRENTEAGPLSGQESDEAGPPAAEKRGDSEATSLYAHAQKSDDVDPPKERYDKEVSERTKTMRWIDVCTCDLWSTIRESEVDEIIENFGHLKYLIDQRRYLRRSRLSSVVRQSRKDRARKTFAEWYDDQPEELNEAEEAEQARYAWEFEGSAWTLEATLREADVAETISRLKSTIELQQGLLRQNVQPPEERDDPKVAERSSTALARARLEDCTCSLEPTLRDCEFDELWENIGRLKYLIDQQKYLRRSRLPSVVRESRRRRSATDD